MAEAECGQGPGPKCATCPNARIYATCSLSFGSLTARGPNGGRSSIDTSVWGKRIGVSAFRRWGKYRRMGVSACRRVGVKTKTALNFRTFVFFVTFCSNALRSLLLRSAPGVRRGQSVSACRRVGVKTKTALNFRTFVFFATFCSNALRSLLLRSAFGEGRAYRRIDVSAFRRFGVKTKTALNFRTFVFFVTFCSNALRSLLAAGNILLQRRVDDYRANNLALFKLGKDILDRYDKFGLGDAITAREPFTGLTRVKMQNLVQDYQDKLADQKIKP